MKLFKTILTYALSMWWAFVLISVIPDLLGLTGVWNWLAWVILYVVVFWVFDLDVKATYTVKFRGKTYSLGS